MLLGEQLITRNIQIIIKQLIEEVARNQACYPTPPKYNQSNQILKIQELQIELKSQKWNNKQNGKKSSQIRFQKSFKQQTQSPQKSPSFESQSHQKTQSSKGCKSCTNYSSTSCSISSQSFSSQSFSQKVRKEIQRKGQCRQKETSCQESTQNKKNRKRSSQEKRCPKEEMNLIIPITYFLIRLFLCLFIKALTFNLIAYHSICGIMIRLLKTMKIYQILWQLSLNACYQRQIQKILRMSHFNSLQSQSQFLNDWYQIQFDEKKMNKVFEIYCIKQRFFRKFESLLCTIHIFSSFLQLISIFFDFSEVSGYQ